MDQKGIRRSRKLLRPLAQRTRKWIRDLNKDKFTSVVEVGADGTFIGGDLELSKGDEDEFEAEVTGAKPGIIWLMSIEPVETEDGGEDDLMGGTPKVIRFV
uniref:Alcohol oxidase n=1 Tax=Ganoderma boninense TaxID=34458 RepID=A0A5K1K2Y9_9APHY|nr:Alcohol oxidase [Ganoderma boninense]